mgnify:CR=1 FL=1
MITRLVSHSPEETIEIGNQFAKELNSGCVITLKGDLGSGKTTFTKGIAKGLDITQTVNSPTFNIQKLYRGRLLLNHIDAYRLEGANQDLGFADYFDDESVTVIEWADYLGSLWISIDYRIEFIRISDDVREILIESVSSDENVNS